MRFKFGTWAAQLKTAALTATRSWSLPDRSGDIALMPTQTAATFSSVVSFDMASLAYASQDVASLIAFTVGSGTKYAGARVIYKLVASGNVAHVPTFTGFNELSDSIGYYNANGIVNIITFEWDGATAWYRITQAKFAIPSIANVGISFPLRSASTAIDGTNPSIYQSTNPEGNLYNSLMVSAQTIPAGRYGRITVYCHPNMILGFNDSGSLQTYSNFEYSLFGYGTKAYTIGTAGGSTVDSGITISSTAARFYRLTRFANGTVTAETSSDNITWSSVITFGNTNTGTLYVAAALSGNQATRYMWIISFELGM